MKTFLFVLAAAIVGSVLCLRLGGSYGYEIGQILGNTVFFILLVACGALQTSGISLRRAVGVSISVTLLLMGCAILGAFIHRISREVGGALMDLVAIGYYPRGPDVPLAPGMGVWVITVIALTLAGLLSGSLLRRLASCRHA